MNVPEKKLTAEGVSTGIGLLSVLRYRGLSIINALPPSLVKCDGQTTSLMGFDAMFVVICLLVLIVVSNYKLLNKK